MMGDVKFSIHNCRVRTSFSCFILCVWFCHGEMVLFLSRSGVVTEWSHLMLMFYEIICFTYETPWSSYECHTTASWELPGLLYLSISLSSISNIFCKGKNAHMWRLPWKCPAVFYTYYTDIISSMKCTCHLLYSWPFSISGVEGGGSDIQHQAISHKGTYFLGICSGYLGRTEGEEAFWNTGTFWICIHAFYWCIYLFAHSHTAFLSGVSFELYYFADFIVVLVISVRTFQ